jgi:hypothetical protein
LERWNEGEIQRTGWGTGSAALGESLPRIGFDFEGRKLQIAMGGCENLRRRKGDEFRSRGAIPGRWREVGVDG